MLNIMKWFQPESKHAKGWHKPKQRKKYKDKCRERARKRREAK